MTDSQISSDRSTFAELDARLSKRKGNRGGGGGGRRRRSRRANSIPTREESEQLMYRTMDLYNEYFWERIVWPRHPDVALVGIAATAASQAAGLLTTAETTPVEIEAKAVAAATQMIAADRARAAEAVTN